MKSFFLRACVFGSLLGLAVLPQQAAHAQVTQTFRYTGGYQSFLVPAGVRRLTVKLWGAGGAQTGGSGAFVTGNLTVTPGASLTLLVGGGGSGSSTVSFGGGGSGSSSGGGGRSAIRLSANNSIVSDELVTAAGGGGGSSIGGGGGGLSVGQSGTGDGPGGGATQTSGGAGGNYADFFFGQAGSRFQGGSAGAAIGGGGGGGGGGYFGGGGGSGNSGGGGGSSYYFHPAFAFNSALSQAGSQGSTSAARILPGGANDPSYLAGIGEGGRAFRNGGHGMIVVSYIAVPEPGSLALLALGAGAFLIAHRRRTP